MLFVLHEIDPVCTKTKAQRLQASPTATHLNTPASDVHADFLKNARHQIWN